MRVARGFHQQWEIFIYIYMYMDILQDIKQPSKASWWLLALLFICETWVSNFCVRLFIELFTSCFPPDTCHSMFLTFSPRLVMAAKAYLWLTLSPWYSAAKELRSSCIFFCTSRWPCTAVNAWPVKVTPCSTFCIRAGIFASSSSWNLLGLNRYVMGVLWGYNFEHWLIINLLYCFIWK